MDQRLAPLREKLVSLETSAELDTRVIRGLKMGRLAQTMAMPVWTVVQTSVREYEGTRLPGT